MTDTEQAPSFVESIENAETPSDAMREIGRLSLRSLVKMPIDAGREIARIVRQGDPAEIARGIH